MDSAKPFILASASPRRKQLLEAMGISFEVYPAQVSENNDPQADPEAVVIENALLKAEAVLAHRPEAIVLGVDTAVALEGEVFHKPQDLTQAYAMLKKLSGKTHTVYSGVCLVSGDGIRECHCVTSKVTFKPLSKQQIESYHALVDPLDRAGAYSIDDHSDLIVESYEGSYTNIMGLPIEFLMELLASLGLMNAK